MSSYPSRMRVPGQRCGHLSPSDGSLRREQVVRLSASLSKGMRMAPFRFWLILSAVVLLVSSSATAANVSFSGQVTSVQSSYMPAFLTFSLKDANTSQPLGDATCPASWFFVFKDSSADKIKAMYATLLAATISGK